MADEKRQRVLQAAFGVFIRYGYRRATMEDIARDAGVSRPALYLVFPSKEAIFREVVETGLEALLRDIEAGLGAQTSLEGRLRHVFEIWSVRTYEMVARSPEARALMASSFDFVSDVFERSGQRLAKRLTDVIRAGVEQPDALRPSAEVRARIMMAAAHGFKTMARDADDMRALVRDLVRVTVAGLPRVEEGQGALSDSRAGSSADRRGRRMGAGAGGAGGGSPPPEATASTRSRSRGRRRA